METQMTTHRASIITAQNLIGVLDIMRRTVTPENQRRNKPVISSPTAGPRVPVINKRRVESPARSRQKTTATPCTHAKKTGRRKQIAAKPKNCDDSIMLLRAAIRSSSTFSGSLDKIIALART